MACPHCRHSGLVSIEMHVRGDGVTLRACPTCERRWWLRGEDQVSLEQVLELAAA